MGGARSSASTVAEEAGLQRADLPPAPLESRAEGKCARRHVAVHDPHQRRGSRCAAPDRPSGRTGPAHAAVPPGTAASPPWCSGAAAAAGCPPGAPRQASSAGASRRPAPLDARRARTGTAAHRAGTRRGRDRDTPRGRARGAVSLAEKNRGWPAAPARSSAIATTEVRPFGDARTASHTGRWLPRTASIGGSIASTSFESAADEMADHLDAPERRARGGGSGSPAGV